ncbi:YciI family protein [Luteipulveratus sp. YIM 133132]|uniref:YciI family protein n=1 Tax=Luteipulveratus flavus TaxID=3031728 RepID=UPI0023B13147|nr:YciI family protein [Luteipulveratus sp. YIM 133132]MDE9366703.1 YciI family protein [Luteipulveratus sp. YIM 133132]
MRFLMLIHDNPRRWAHPTFAQHGSPPEDIARWQQELDDLLAELNDSGEYVSGLPLADPARSRTVRVVDEEMTVVDGPLAEAKEQLAGYMVLDCASWERAEEIAGRFPSSRFGPIELRPVMFASGAEM